MPRFMVVHAAPFTAEELMARAKAAPSYVPKDVSWKCSYCAFKDNRHFCEWEAPNEKVLRRVLDLTKTPFEKIYRVQRFDAVQAQFET
jgi:nucleotidyltransferase/DNA polymerase involved in DNA repair